MVFGHPDMAFGHPDMAFGHPDMAFGHPDTAFGHPDIFLTIGMTHMGLIRGKNGKNSHVRT